MNRFQIGIILLLFLNSIFFISCKKEKLLPVTPVTCLIDSVTVYNGVSFHFKYKGEQVDEIRSFLYGQPWHIISHIYSGNLLLTKTFYYIPTQSITRKYEYKYTTDHLTSFIQYRYNPLSALYEKVRSSVFTYNGIQLSTVNISSFNATDSITPSTSSIYYYSGINGNTDSAFSIEWSNSALYYKYNVTAKLNSFKKNNFFLIDPTTIHSDFLFDPVFLPIILNENYTTIILKPYEVFMQIRSGANNNNQPLFLSWGPYNSDYYYNCK